MILSTPHQSLTGTSKKNIMQAQADACGSLNANNNSVPRIGAGSTLEQTILRTIVYFDLFSYPLTELEIWKWQFHDRNYESGIMNQGYRLEEIVETIEKSEALKNVLDFNNGFYFLKGR